MRNATSMRMLLVAGTLMHAMAAPAVAQPAPAAAQPRASAASEAPGTSETDERPWARGVSAAQQRQALALYRAGTQALKELLFATAATRYREALVHWDHPGIHYHLAIALINLERPIEAYRSVHAALRYDGAALHSDQRMQALHSKTLLQQRVAALAVACAEPGATVLLDGQRVLTGPGWDKRLVLPGVHQVVVRKPGRPTRTHALVLSPGTRTAVDIEWRREMLARWIPWAMVGTGVASGGLGGVLHWRADIDMSRFDAFLALRCFEGCKDEEAHSPVWLMERARWEQRAAVAAYAAGAGLVIAGLVLAWIEPERSFLLDERRTPGEPLLAPSVSPTGAGLTVNTLF